MQYILYGFEPLLHPEVEITDFRSGWCVHTPPTDMAHLTTSLSLRIIYYTIKAVAHVTEMLPYTPY
jgi:hypothetical protein